MRLTIELNEKDMRRLKQGKTVEVKGANARPYTKIEIVKKERG